MALRVQIIGNDKLSKKLKTIGKDVKGLAFGFNNIDRVLRSALLIGGVNAAAKFSKGLAEISTLMDNVSAKAIPKMSRELKDLSVQSGLVLDSLVKARYDIVSAGFSKAAESAKVLAGSAKLAVGGVTAAAQAADLVTSALNSFQLGAEATTRVTDALFTTVKLGKTTITELAGSLGNLLPTASAVGATIENVGAIMATVTAGGIRTAEAVTAVNGALFALNAPTDQAAKAMKNADIEVRKFADGSLDLLKTIEQFKGLSLEEITKFVPERRAAKAILSLSNNFEKLNINVKEFEKILGATDTAVEKIEKSAGQKLAVTMAQLKVVMLDIGETVMPLVLKGAEELSRFFSGTGTDAINGLGGAVGFLTENFDLLAASIKLAGVAFVGLKIARMTGLVWGLSKAVAAVVAIGSGITGGIIAGVIGSAIVLAGIGKALLGIDNDLIKIQTHLEAIRDTDLTPQEKFEKLTPAVIAFNKSLKAVNKSFQGTDAENIDSATASVLELVDTMQDVSGIGRFALSLKKQEDNLKKTEDGAKFFADAIQTLVLKLGDLGIGGEKVITVFDRLFPTVAITTKEIIASIDATIAKQDELTAAIIRTSSAATLLASGKISFSFPEIPELPELGGSEQADRLAAMQKTQSEKRIELFVEEHRRKLEITQQFAAQASQISSGLNNLLAGNVKRRVDAEIKGVLESSASEETKAAKIKNIREQGVQDEKDIQKKLAPIRLAAATAQAALAVINGLATIPLIPVGIAAGALAGTLGAIEVATIASQSFAKGGMAKGAAKGARITGFATGGAQGFSNPGQVFDSRDSIKAMVRPGEFISSPEATAGNLDKLIEMNQGALTGAGNQGGGTTIIYAMDGESVQRVLEKNPQAVAAGNRRAQKIVTFSNRRLRRR